MSPRGAGPGPHPVFARVWSHVSGLVGSDRVRRELLAGLHGRVLEVGAGDGRNLALYPATVTEVVAVEPEPHLRALAEHAARQAPVPVRVLEGSAESLPPCAGGYDAVVVSLVLCTVPDQAAALAQIDRVLAPGGELRFFEHVRAQGRLGTLTQAALDRSRVWPTLGGGCHLSRDTVAALETAGFAVQRIRRFPSGPGPAGVPFVLGAARRAGAV